VPTDQAARTRGIPVWDLLVRFFHWSLVVGFFAAYFTRHSSGSIHNWIGYAVLGLLLMRLLWGFVGPGYARFAQFVRSPCYILSYSKLLLAGRQPRYLGHNPLGGWMVLALISSVLATCITGWLYTTDRFWGVAWVEELHDGFTWFTLLLIVMHIAGVIHASRHGKENLPAAMLHGRKRSASGNDVD
jgi:cytochrome b